MVKVQDCPNCGSTDLRISAADATGHEGPDLLPGIGGFFRPAKFAVVVCCSCGLTRFFVTREEIDKLKARWEPLQE